MPVMLRAILNNIASLILEDKKDWYYGVKILPSQLVKYLNFVNQDICWGIESYFYMIHKRLNLPFKFLNCKIKAPKKL